MELGRRSLMHYLHGLEVTIYRDGKIWQQRFEDGGSKNLGS